MVAKYLHREEDAMTESRKFKMKYSPERGLYYLTNGTRRIWGSEIQAAAFAMEAGERPGMEVLKFHSPLGKTIHVRTRFSPRRGSIVMPTF